MKKAKETTQPKSSDKKPTKANSEANGDEKIKDIDVKYVDTSVAPKPKVAIKFKKSSEQEKAATELIDISDDKPAEKIFKPRSDETKAQISTTLKKKLGTKKGQADKKKSIEKRVQTVQKANEKLRADTTEKLCNGPSDGGKCCGKVRPIADFWPRKEGSLARTTYCHECEAKIRTAVTYTCPHCPTTFNRKDNMNAHVAKKHSKIIVLDP